MFRFRMMKLFSPVAEEGTGSGNGEQVTAQVGNDTDQVIRQAVQKARDEEKRKLYSEIEAAKAERERIAAELERRDRETKEKQLAALPPDQQVLARMKELEETVARERGERMRVEASAQQQIRQLGLLAYRERALRDVPTEVASLVNGASEEEIDAAAENAANIYSALEAKLRSQFAAEHPAQAPVLAPPPNPAYAGYTGGALPMPTNPLPIAEDQNTSSIDDVVEFTSEQAVRSGKYGGELREQLLRRVRGQGSYTGSIGSNPRHLNTRGTNHTEMPGGVLQPQGSPMGPASPPQYQGSSPVQAQQVVVPPNDGRSEALAAIQRTHSGRNPAVAGNPAASAALQTAQAHAVQRGISNQNNAFSSRFQNTPPAKS